MIYPSFVIAPMLAGLVQGVTGFGGGIITMLIFPLFVSIPVGAGITSALGIPLCLSMVIRYRDEVNVKMALLPALLYNVISSLVISYSVYVDQVTIKKIFGVFLILLCLYYLFVSKSVQNRKLSLPLSIVCIAISATCDGLFGIGGPLMAVYFVSASDGKESYIANLQFLFAVTNVVNFFTRISKGFYTFDLVPVTLLGFAGITLGKKFGLKILDRLDLESMKKGVYLFVGLSGILNVIQQV